TDSGHLRSATLPGLLAQAAAAGIRDRRRPWPEHRLGSGGARRRHPAQCLAVADRRHAAMGPHLLAAGLGGRPGGKSQRPAADAVRPRTPVRADDGGGRDGGGRDCRAAARAAAAGRRAGRPRPAAGGALCRGHRPRRNAMSFALTAVLLALGWAAAHGSFTFLNLLFGGAVGVVALYLIRDRVEAPRLSRRLRRILSLALLFIYELVMSAVKVAALVLRPDMHRVLTPGVIAFPLAVKSDAEITILASLITLTPGTLSVDVSEDRQHLYVHTLDMRDRDAVVRGI